MVRPASPSPRIRARIAHESATATPARIAVDLGAVLRLQIGDRISLVQTACQPRDRIVDGRSQAQRAVSESLHLQPRTGSPAEAVAERLWDDHLALAGQLGTAPHLTCRVRRSRWRVKVAGSTRAPATRSSWKPSRSARARREGRAPVPAG